MKKKIKDRFIVHTWDLDIRVVKISSKFFNILNKKFFTKFESPTKAAVSIQYLFNYSFDSIRNFVRLSIDGSLLTQSNAQKSVPIKILFELCKTLDISPEFIEKNIEIIRPSRSKLLICNPKFPRELDPINSSLLFHYYGDGSKENWCQDRQKHPLNRDRFLKKVEYVLGDLINWKSKKHKEIYTPKILYRFFSKMFDIDEDFNKNVAPPIEYFSKECLVSALCSVIMDDGHVSKSHYEIRISQKNENLIELFYELCKRLKYEVSKICNYNKGIFHFKIKFFGVLRFYKDLNDLKEEYGDILDLGDKQNELEDLVHHMNEKLVSINKKRARGYHKTLVQKDIEVLKFLEKNNSTRKRIENELRFSFREAHKRIGTLKQNGLIQVVGFKNRGYVYKITTKGKNLLKEWKTKEEKDFELRQQVYNFYSKSYINNFISVKEICDNVHGLHLKKFYNLWKTKRHFNEEVLKFNS